MMAKLIFVDVQAMKEADLERWTVDTLKKNNPKRVVDNLTDIATIGMPDLAVTQLKRTTWIELKYVAFNYKELTKARKFYVQLEHMRRLAKHGHAWYLLFYGAPEIIRTEIWAPSELLQRVELGAGQPVSFVGGRSLEDVERLLTGGFA